MAMDMELASFSRKLTGRFLSLRVPGAGRKKARQGEGGLEEERNTLREKVAEQVALIRRLRGLGWSSVGKRGSEPETHASVRGGSRRGPLSLWIHGFQATNSFPLSG